MHEDYDFLLERYEKYGEIPVAEEMSPTIFLGRFECPYCKNWFGIYDSRIDIVHCPYCCMELELGWYDVHND